MLCATPASPTQEGVVDKEQAQALACICDYLKLDWQITSRYSTSEGSEQEE